MKELVSIIVPIYNTERYLEKCINSIVKQTYKELEIILVDDGSTDKSSEICDEWKEKDKRVKVIHKENEGLSLARNEGIKNSTGKYLFFIDSDDYIEQDIIEKLHTNIKENNSDISTCGFYLETYSKKIPNNAKSNYVADSEEALRRLFSQDDMSIAIWDKLYKRELFEEITFPNCIIYEELKTLYKLLDKANKISHINEVGYHYVQREGSLLHSKINNDPLEIIETVDEILNFVKRNYPNIIESVEVFFIRNLNNCIVVSYKKGMKNEYKILKNKLKQYTNEILKNSEMRLNTKFKSIMIAYLGFSRFYKK